MRLDAYLVENRYFESRNKAQEAIKSGHVRVDGAVVKKMSIPITGQSVELLQQVFYVGRGALKLKHFLQKNPFRIEGVDCLDVGSSTGGFAQVLLEQGAESVTCVDVGTDQLHGRLRADPRIRVHEQTDIRTFDPGRTYPVVTGDISFISLSHLFLPVSKLASGIILLLFKPQFEVSPGVKRTKNGVVLDDRAVEESKNRLIGYARDLGWTLVVESPSELAGKEGNIETFLCFRQNGH